MSGKDSRQPPHFWGKRGGDIWRPPQPRIEFAPSTPDLRRAVQERFGTLVRADAHAADMPTFWAEASEAVALLSFLKDQAPRRFRRLEDLTAIDERERRHLVHVRDAADRAQRGERPRLQPTPAFRA